MAKTAHNQMQVGTLDPLLSQSRFSRGGVLFGDPRDYLRGFAENHNLSVVVDSTGAVNIVDLAKLLSGDMLPPTQAPYAPPIPPGSKQVPDPNIDYCLVGTPEQTYQGATITVLLHPSLKIGYPPDVVKLDMSKTVINLMAFPNPDFGSDSGFIPPPTASGNFIVAGIRHVGDTRGVPWYSEIVGVTQAGLLAAMGHQQ